MNATIVPSDRAFRSRRRDESAIAYLYDACYTRTGHIPNVAEERVVCPVDPLHTCIIPIRHYFASGECVLYCVDGCSEAQVYAALGIDPASLVDQYRTPARNRAARRRIAARRLAEVS